MIEDSLHELPRNAIVITTSNQFFFDSWYEQLHTNKYNDLTFVYFPNNTNKDFEKYHPELLSGKPNETIEAQTKETNNTVYKEIIEILARNANRPIYIWQGDLIDPSRQLFSGLFFPYGLWWHLNSTQDNDLRNSMISQKLLTNFMNTPINYASLTDEQRFLDLNVYSSAYLTTGIELAKVGKYTDALVMFNKSLSIDPNNSHNTVITNDITTINDIQSLEPTLQSLVATKDETTLMRLAQDYYALGNYTKGIEIYKKIILFDSKNAEIYSNIGALYAMIHDKKNGLLYFNKALKINPTLEFAIQGENKLENAR